jgi:hypothetical protein
MTVKTQKVCNACSKYAMECPCDIVSLGNIERGQKLLQYWQVEYIGPLPRSLHNYYILTVVDKTTGLLFVSAAMHTSQDTTK